MCYSVRRYATHSMNSKLGLIFSLKQHKYNTLAHKWWQACFIQIRYKKMCQSILSVLGKWQLPWPLGLSIIQLNVVSKIQLFLSCRFWVLFSLKYDITDAILQGTEKWKCSISGVFCLICLKFCRLLEVNVGISLDFKFRWYGNSNGNN